MGLTGNYAKNIFTKVLSKEKRLSSFNFLLKCLPQLVQNCSLGTAIQLLEGWKRRNIDF